jgi:hypothetical protein
MKSVTERARLQPAGKDQTRAGVDLLDPKRGVAQVLKIVMEDMQDGEIAAMYEEGGDAVILVARDLPDDMRCAAVNRLLARVTAVAAASAALFLFLAHLAE